jgi:hypothetical protein
MKKLLTLFLVPICLLLTAFTVRKLYRTIQEPLYVDTRPAIEVIMPKLQAPKLEINLRDHTAFLYNIGHYESGNRYSIVNKWGYMGRYQFHISTVEGVGIKATKEQFLNSPSLQEEAMDRLLTFNYKTLRRYIRKYDGKVLHGVLVTKSGVLAAAHLGGAGNVRNWFRNGKNFADANGTQITKYMKIFSNYQLDL